MTSYGHHGAAVVAMMRLWPDKVNAGCVAIVGFKIVVPCTPPWVAWDLLPSPSGSGNKSHTALVGMVYNNVSIE